MSHLMTLCLATVIYLTGIVIYRLYLHPLAQFPGPWPAKVSGLHALYYAWRGDRHLMQARSHARYGDYVRLGPNYLSVASDLGLQEIYGTRANVQKSSFYHAFVAQKGAWSTFTSIDRSLHARKRRVLAPAMTERALKSMGRRINQCIDIFVTQLGRNADAESGWTPAVNMSELADHVAFDILGDLVFGEGSFQMLTSRANRYIVDLIVATSYWALLVGTFPLLRALPIIPLWFPELTRKRQAYLLFCQEKACQRMAKVGAPGPSPEEHSDLLLHLLKPSASSPPSTAEIWAECRTLIVAGADTVATALAALTHYLVHNEGAYHRLEEEILTACPRLHEVRFPGPRPAQCPYLDACIDEALRLSPPIPGPLPREVLRGGMALGRGRFVVPAGTVVATAAYALHRHPRYFPQPEVFWPERWMAGSAPGVTLATVRRARQSFCPFGVGARGCVGQSLAYGELRTLVVRMLGRYRIRLCRQVRVGEGPSAREIGGDGVSKEGEEYRMLDRWTAQRDGPFVEFQSRPR
ncbi:cytochrome P450 [Aspergillus fijiensis CBS 313.89]|uniref:Cytochrome P450 n=1 Tax=Aspergillus fijiensis CBS 313.89 TaxID=1448319 RepID=A0A8G1RI95_9EURO|nr:cytochrome P450 [Aspergillus fijiensis CBS 313.89]RAK74437.1 cytochrome P450 [Aspergillus fijiensis CBS 313.89]